MPQRTQPTEAPKEHNDGRKCVDLSYNVFKFLDKFIIPLVGASTSLSRVENLLRIEGKLSTDQNETEYLFSSVEKIHGRAGALVGHLSIMLAITMFFLENTSSAFSKILIGIDFVVYLLLVILTLRCLKVMGIDEDYDVNADKHYKNYISMSYAEMSLKYSILQLTSSLAILATVFLMLAFVLGIIIP